MIFIKRHYLSTAQKLKKLDKILNSIDTHTLLPMMIKDSHHPRRTAVLLVNGFTGLGLTTLSKMIRAFPDLFDTLIFLQVGLIDAGVFKGHEDIEKLQKKVKNDVDRYTKIAVHYGYQSEGISSLGLDIVKEVDTLSKEVLQKYPNATFFGGQLVFEQTGILTKWLHNSVVFAIQEQLFLKGVPFIILPVQV